MFFLKHILPLLLISAVIGFIVARLNLLPPVTQRGGDVPVQQPAPSPASRPAAPAPVPEPVVESPEPEPPVPAGDEPVAEAVVPEGWSADHFLDVLEEDGDTDDAPAVAVGEVAREIRSAAQQTEHRAADPYLESVLKEARELSVTAVPPSGEVVRGAAPTSVGDQARFYVVQEGDTLSSIADQVYGDRMAYRRIYDANRDVLRTPDDVLVGQRLRIPND